MRQGGGPGADIRRSPLSCGGPFALAGLVITAIASADAWAAPAGRGDPDPLVRQYELRRLNERQVDRPDLTLPRLGAPSEPTGTAPLFVLRSLSFSGNAAIESDALQRCVAEFTGKAVSERDLWEITQRLTRLYQERGFFLSRAFIQPQDAKAGRLVVTLVEGHVVDIALRGEGAGRYGLDAILQPIRAERPLNVATFERQLLLASDLPGVRITDSAIEEVDAASGAYRLVVSVEAWGSKVSRAAE
jgi:hemolysin activation/secretion protein